MFSQIKFVVSKHCMDTLHDTYTKVIDGNISAECNNQWWNIALGMPCPHQVSAMIASRSPIPPDSIHKFWKQLSWDLMDQPDETIPLSFPRMRMNHIMRRFQIGDIPKATMLKICNAYDDDVNPGGTNLLEPPSDKSKQDRKKKHNPCQTNPLRSEKKQQEWEKEQQKE